MKKSTGIFLVMLLCLVIPLQAWATQMTTCTVSVDSVAATPGEIVAVAVRIADNPGFTNFAIALDYNPEHLTLVELETEGEEDHYLCGTQVGVNNLMEGENGETWGFAVSAASDSMKEDGILFTAVFRIEPGYTGEETVTPLVRYIRNNEAAFAVFEEIHASVTAGTITSVLTGDVNGDGIIEYDDVMLVYKAFLGQAELTAEQLAAVDENGNGILEESEYQAIYQIYIGG